MLENIGWLLAMAAALIALAWSVWFAVRKPKSVGIATVDKAAEAAS